MLGAFELSKMLSQSLGKEKAEAEVMRVVRARRLNPECLTQEDALAILEVLANMDGIVGVTARFAKGRVHLRWSDSTRTKS